MRKNIPAPLLKIIAAGLADGYWLFQRRQCATVVNNFLPLFNGDRTLAERAARAVHRNFAAKLIDLWRVEAGEVTRNWLTNDGELEIIHAARRRGRGTLFITLHLGNWEHGGQLLDQLGIRLTILSQAEPDDALTELRKAARASYGVDTLIIGDDSFAFVEVIKRLQAGADMAVSLDRPPDRGGVLVEFFGHPFEASLAAAELARASGCAILGVTIVRHPNGYTVKVLPEFVYDRQALGNREARRELTQQILRAFEPEIRKNIEQWYQFTPLWPKTPMNRISRVFTLLCAILLWATMASVAADYDEQFNQWFTVQTNLQSWAGDFTQTRTLTVLNQPLDFARQSVGATRRIPLGNWPAGPNDRAPHAGPTAHRLSPAQARGKISPRRGADRPHERRAGLAGRQPAARPGHDGTELQAGLGNGDQWHFANDAAAAQRSGTQIHRPDGHRLSHQRFHHCRHGNEICRRLEIAQRFHQRRRKPADRCENVRSGELPADYTVTEPLKP